MRQSNMRARRVVVATGAFVTTGLLVGGAAVAQTGPEAAAVPGPGTVTAKASSIFRVDSARRHVLEGSDVVVRGVLRPGGLGRPVALQVLGRRRWVTVDVDRTDRLGRYRLDWRPTDTGSRTVRLRVPGTDSLSGARRVIGRTNVYRPALASWYGPGLYGGHLACGGRLTAGTLGVAHKTLPCGTRVTLRYRGRSIRVPVVDRGPFVGAREFDLTSATRARLGFDGTGAVLVTV